MARVKIESHNPKDPRRTSRLLEILSCNDVYVTRLIPVNDGFVILTSTGSELDKIFNNITDKQLVENELSPQIPSELRANRSAVLFKVDSHIFDNTEEDIKEEIQIKNDWVGEIIHIYKFAKGNVIRAGFANRQHRPLA